MPESIPHPVAPLEDPPAGELVICHSCHIAIRGAELVEGDPIHYRICDVCKGFVVDMVTITVPRKDVEVAIDLLDDSADVGWTSDQLFAAKIISWRLLDALGRAT